MTVSKQTCITSEILTSRGELTYNVNNLPGNDQAVNVEEDAEDNQTVDDNDEEHSQQDIGPLRE